jgi:hypothetical protein
VIDETVMIDLTSPLITQTKDFFFKKGWYQRGNRDEKYKSCAWERREGFFFFFFCRERLGEREKWRCGNAPLFFFWVQSFVSLV